MSTKLALKFFEHKRVSQCAEGVGQPNGVTARYMNTGDRRVTPRDALAYTVNDACLMADLGRTLIYEFFKDGRLKKIKLNRRTLVCGDSLRALIAGGAP